MKQFSGTISVQKSLKQGEALSPLLFKFVLEFSVRKNHAKQEGIKWNGTRQLPICVDYGNLLTINVHTMKNTQDLSVGSRVFQRFFRGRNPKIFFSHSEESLHTKNCAWFSRRICCVDVVVNMGSSEWRSGCLYERSRRNHHAFKGY
jgi:hypothetical protein